MANPGNVDFGLFIIREDPQVPWIGMTDPWAKKVSFTGAKIKMVIDPRKIISVTLAGVITFARVIVIVTVGSTPRHLMVTMTLCWARR